MNKNKSLKVYINKVNEDWIIDRVRKEWVSNNNPYSKYFSSCNVVWLIAPWV